MQYGSYCRSHGFYIVWQASIEHCLRIFMMDLDCSDQNWGKALYCTCPTDSWKCFWNSKQVNSDTCNMEITVEITVFILSDKLPLNIA